MTTLGDIISRATKAQCNITSLSNEVIGHVRRAGAANDRCDLTDWLRDLEYLDKEVIRLRKMLRTQNIQHIADIERT